MREEKKGRGGGRTCERNEWVEGSRPSEEQTENVMRTLVRGELENLRDN